MRLGREFPMNVPWRWSATLTNMRRESGGDSSKSDVRVAHHSSDWHGGPGGPPAGARSPFGLSRHPTFLRTEWRASATSSGDRETITATGAEGEDVHDGGLEAECRADAGDDAGVDARRGWPGPSHLPPFLFPLPPAVHEDAG